jgi:hypothetical protein
MRSKINYNCYFHTYFRQVTGIYRIPIDRWASIKVAFVTKPIIQRTSITWIIFHWGKAIEVWRWCNQTGYRMTGTYLHVAVSNRCLTQTSFTFRSNTTRFISLKSTDISLAPLRWGKMATREAGKWFCALYMRIESIAQMKIASLVLWVSKSVCLQKETNVSEEHTASIFRMEMLEAVCSFETLSSTYESIWRHPFYFIVRNIVFPVCF